MEEGNYYYHYYYHYHYYLYYYYYYYYYYCYICIIFCIESKFIIFLDMTQIWFPLFNVDIKLRKKGTHVVGSGRMEK